MRIVHTCLRYPPATGGVETYVEAIVKRTRNIDTGRDVRVLTSSMRTHGPISLLAPDLLLDDPIYVQRLHHAGTPFISYPRLQALSYYLAHHEPDIIHGYSFWYQPADVAARYARRHGIPFIFHPIYYENNIRNKPLWRLYKKTIGRQTFAAADVVVVISPHEQSLIAEAGFPVKKFVLIPPGVDLAAISEPQPSPFAGHGIRGRILLAVSRLAAGKGLDDIIRVMPELVRQHHDIQLVIVGEDFGARKYLQNMAKQSAFAANIHFIGKLSRTELIGAYQHSHIFIHTSHYEAFGIVLAEAQAAGLPVVARDTSAIPYVVEHERTGLLFSTPQQMSAQLSQLLSDEATRRQLANNARSSAQKKFSWEPSISKLLNLYANVAR